MNTMTKANMKQLANAQVVDVQPVAADDPHGVPSDTMRPARIGMWVLAVGLGGFLLWAGLAPLDEGVPTHGMVTLDTKSRSVQHMSGGIVKAVLVREGDAVEEGQVLLELDAAAAMANHESARQRYLGLRAMQGRLQAEQTGQARIQFHADLLASKADPVVAGLMSAQQDLLQARRSALQSELAAMEESYRGQEHMVQAYKAMLTSRQSQLRLLEQELNQTKPLVSEGYAPKNRLLELERSLADVQASLSDLNGQVARAMQAMAEIRQRQSARQQEVRKEVETQYADVSREVQADGQKLLAVAADLQRMQIRSPAQGQVVGLAVQTPGAVVQPGQKLMMVVPKDEPLLLETRIPPNLIDKVATDLKTDIRFSTFSHSPSLVVQGKVESVSADLLNDPATNIPYYLARVVVTPEGMKTLGNRRMQPGMPAEVIIKTGERTMLTYLTGPLVRRVAAAMKEE